MGRRKFLSSTKEMIISDYLKQNHTRLPWGLITNQWAHQKPSLMSAVPLQKWCRYILFIFLLWWFNWSLALWSFGLLLLHPSDLTILEAMLRKQLWGLVPSLFSLAHLCLAGGPGPAPGWLLSQESALTLVYQQPHEWHPTEHQLDFTGLCSYAQVIFVYIYMCRIMWYIDPMCNDQVRIICASISSNFYSFSMLKNFKFFLLLWKT